MLYGFKTNVMYDNSMLEIQSVDFPNFSGTKLSNTEKAGLVSTIGVGSPTETYDFTTQKIW